MRAHDCTLASLTIFGCLAYPGLALPSLGLASSGVALLASASASIAPGLGLPCIALLASPALTGPPTPPPESPLSLPEKIFNKIGGLVEKAKYSANYVAPPPVSGMKKSVVRAGNTCGQPKINSQMKNLTVDIGDTAR